MLPEITAELDTTYTIIFLGNCLDYRPRIVAATIFNKQYFEVNQLRFKSSDQAAMEFVQTLM